MTKRVSNIVLDPQASPTDARVHIELLGSDVGYGDDGVIEAVWKGRTSAGVWVADLVPNDDLLPEGTAYRVTESVGHEKRTHIIQVLAALSDYDAEDESTIHMVGDLLVDAPGTLESPALALHEDDPDAHSPMLRPIKIVTDGDSLTQGFPGARADSYPARLQAAHETSGPDWWVEDDDALGIWPIRNVSKFGSTIAMCIGRAKGAIDGQIADQYFYANRVVVLWVGIIDIFSSVPAADIFADINQYISDRHDMGLKVCVLTVTPCGLVGAQETIRTDLNDLLKGETCDADLVVDVAATLDDYTDEVLFADGLHLNAAGYQVVADLVDSALGPFLSGLSGTYTDDYPSPPLPPIDASDVDYGAGTVEDFLVPFTQDGGYIETLEALRPEQVNAHDVTGTFWPYLTGGGPGGVADGWISGVADLPQIGAQITVVIDPGDVIGGEDTYTGVVAAYESSVIFNFIPDDHLTQWDNYANGSSGVGCTVSYPDKPAEGTTLVWQAGSGFVLGPVP